MEAIERIDIAAEVAALAEKLGLDKTNVARFDITPANIDATVFLLNEDGKKHFNPDGFPVMTVRTFRVLT